MTYALNNHLFVENGPAVLASRTLARSSSSAFRAWRGLNSDRRMDLVNEALKNSSEDEFPAAL